MKKIIFCLLLISFTVNVSFAKDFEDVKKDDWFYDNLKKVVEKDIIDGYPDNTFKPDNKFTGKEFIAALIKSQDISFNSTGKDWAKPYLKKAKDLKYLDENISFDLDKTLSRENMAYIISNFLINKEEAQLKDIDFIKSKIKDNEKIDKSLRNRVYLTFKKGIILGYPDKSYKPKNGLTRAEGLTIIKRIIDKSERKKVYKDDVDIVYNEDTDTYTVDTEGIGFSE
ncbi:MAG: S-layer homology domain-containing protein, partial [Bacillota bacterium]